MSSWYGTKLGFRVDPSEKELASQFLKVLGANEEGEMTEKIGELSGGSYEYTVSGVFDDDTLEMETVLERAFSEYKSGESEEDEDEDDYTLDDIWYVANKLFGGPVMYLVHEDGKSDGNISDDVYYRYEAMYSSEKKEELNCYCNRYFHGTDTSIDDLKRRRTDRSSEKSKIKRPGSGLIKLLAGWAEKEGLDELAQKLKEKPVKMASEKKEKENPVAGLKISGNTVVGYSGSDEKLEIPEGITAIGEFAFSSRSKLVSVSLPASLERIGMGAFDRCKKLEQIEIPENVSFIGEAAFNECKSLKEIRIPEKTADIGNAAFINCDGLQQVVFSHTLKSIGSCAFCNCKRLTELILPTSLSELGSEAFAGCSGLIKAVVPKALEQVVKDDRIFDGCKKLADIQYV